MDEDCHGKGPPAPKGIFVDTNGKPVAPKPLTPEKAVEIAAAIAAEFQNVSPILDNPFAVGRLIPLGGRTFVIYPLEGCDCSLCHLQVEIARRN